VVVGSAKAPLGVSVLMIGNDDESKLCVSADDEE